MKFFGKVGYAKSVEVEPGIWEDQVTEVDAYGDVTRDTRRFVSGSDLNSDLTVENVISIMADTYSTDHFHAMRYVEWAGVQWSVATVTVEGPRLLLRLGGEYNGPTPPPSGDPGGGAG